MDGMKPRPGEALDDERVSTLLEAAGPRPRPSPAAHERARVSARDAWRAGLPRRRISVPRWVAAAVLALAALAGARFLAPRPPRAAHSAVTAPSPATLERVEGVARAWGAGVPAELRAGARLPAGLTIETARGRVALRLASGIGVRMDRDSRLSLLGVARLRLERGAVYVDSGPAGARGTGLSVETPVGVARDVGTQFEVRLTQVGVRVRVREGAVRLERASGADTAQAGEELELAAALARGKVATHGAAWEWTSAIAPAFVIEGRSAAEVLRWTAREAGLQLSFADDGSARLAERARVHGAIEGASLDEALRIVLPTCDLDFRVRQGVLAVFRAESRR